MRHFNVRTSTFVSQVHDDVMIESIRVARQPRPEVATEWTDMTAFLEIEGLYPLVEVLLAQVDPCAPNEGIPLAVHGDFDAAADKKSFSVDYAIIRAELNAFIALIFRHPLSNGGCVKPEGWYALMDLVAALATELEGHLVVPNTRIKPTREAGSA